MSEITVPNPLQDALRFDTSEKLPFVSVILPVYNDAKALRRCLKSLRKQTFPVDRFEVIVVDNGSTKDDPQAVVADFPGYRYSVETKVGSYAARNKGISLAKGDAYAFIDSDCVAYPQWMEEGVRTLLAHPECGLVGGRVDFFEQDPEHPTSVELFELVVKFNLKEWIEKRHVCMTCNMFVWKKVIDMMGQFNENLKSSGDVEWSSRVHAAGLKLIYNDKTCIQHPARRSWHEIIKRYRRLEGGRHDLRLQRSGSNISKSLLRKIYHIFVPRIFLMRKYCSNDRLKSRGERLRVALVFVICHYTGVLERIRLKLGFHSTRS
jgi:glycosyltransferase involved in cell wall biosynthesis